MIRLTAVIPAQQQNPKVRGLPPVFMSLTMSVLRPMAAMARTMKNLLSSLRGENTDISIPCRYAYGSNNGSRYKIKYKEGKYLLDAHVSGRIGFLCFSRPQKARMRVMGIIARVLVSLTVTAVSRVDDPKP